MRKSIQKWAYALVTCAFALALCVSFSACSSDDDNNGTDGIVPVLFSEFDGHYSVLYPLGLTNESVFVNISETLAGQQIDLTKPGDWSAGGSFVGGDLMNMMSISSKMVAMSTFVKLVTTRLNSVLSMYGKINRESRLRKEAIKVR